MNKYEEQKICQQTNLEKFNWKKDQSKDQSKFNCIKYFTVNIRKLFICNASICTAIQTTKSVQDVKEDFIWFVFI